MKFIIINIFAIAYYYILEYIFIYLGLMKDDIIKDLNYIIFLSLLSLAMAIYTNQKYEDLIS